MRKILLLASVALFLSSCSWLNPSIMLKTPKDYTYSKSPDSTKAMDYKISPNDLLQFNMYSNDGFKLIDISSLNSANSNYRVNQQLPYMVESDGNVKLPILGRQKLGGLTLREAEVMLETAYAEYYIKPFVEMNIINRRVIVFPGSPGDAKVIPLENNNTTLIEAIALAGGISEDGKAKIVKLIRDINGKHEVYLIDLSTIAGIKDANTVLQENDIIYVEPRRKYATKFLQEIAPYVSIVTSFYVLLTYSTLISKK